MLFTIQDEERAMRVHMAELEREAFQKGFDKGFAEGLAEGRAESRKQTLEQHARMVMDSLSIGADEALDALQVPAEIRPELAARLARTRQTT